MPPLRRFFFRSRAAGGPSKMGTGSVASIIVCLRARLLGDGACPLFRRTVNIVGPIRLGSKGSPVAEYSACLG